MAVRCAMAFPRFWLIGRILAHLAHLAPHSALLYCAKARLLVLASGCENHSKFEKERSASEQSATRPGNPIASLGIEPHAVVMPHKVSSSLAR